MARKAAKSNSIDYTEPREFAKLLTQLEDAGPTALVDWPQLRNISKLAFRIGITGPPGAGKSTLVNRLITEARRLDLRVGILAVDPSSPFTHGAVLGDRVRYQQHFLDEKVFIRSIGTRGSAGGLHGSTWLMVRAFDLAGYDILILETVGVGQTELQIMNVADHISLVLVPESGDGIQGMKAGILEIADIYLVNKADRPGADIFENELRSALELAAEKPAEILKISAAQGMGLDPYFTALWKAREDSTWKRRRRQPERLQAEARALAQELSLRWVESSVSKVADEDSLIRTLQKVARQLE